MRKSGVALAEAAAGLTMSACRSHGEDAPDDHHDAHGEEAQVPRELVRSRMNMVEPEQLMVDHALDEVEHAPAEEQRPDKGLGGPGHVGALPRLPETRHT